MKSCNGPNATHYAGCDRHEAKRGAEIKRLEAELAKASTLQQRLTIAEGTITDLRNENATLKNKLRADRQVDAGHAMYRGGLLDQIATLKRKLAAIHTELPLLRDGLIADCPSFRDGWRAAISAVSNMIPKP